MTPISKASAQQRAGRAGLFTCAAIKILERVVVLLVLVLVEVVVVLVLVVVVVVVVGVVVITLLALCLRGTIRINANI